MNKNSLPAIIMASLMVVASFAACACVIPTDNDVNDANNPIDPNGQLYSANDKRNLEGWCNDITVLGECFICFPSFIKNVNKFIDTYENQYRAYLGHLYDGMISNIKSNAMTINELMSIPDTELSMKICNNYVDAVHKSEPGMSRDRVVALVDLGKTNLGQMKEQFRLYIDPSAIALGEIIMTLENMCDDIAERLSKTTVPEESIILAEFRDIALKMEPRVLSDTMNVWAPYVFLKTSVEISLKHLCDIEKRL